MYNLAISPLQKGVAKCTQKVLAGGKGVSEAAQNLSKIKLSPKQLDTSVTKFKPLTRDTVTLSKRDTRMLSDSASPEWCW